MLKKNESPEHAQIKSEMVSVCGSLGFDTKQEFRGSGWRADVIAINDTTKVAFEIQLSPQGLNKTLERQEKYLRDGIRGCWLFQRPVRKLREERPDLPLFYVSTNNSRITVSLIDGRKEVSLSEFVQAFVLDEIRFCDNASAKCEQPVRICFFEMECWKCKAANHIFYVEEPYISSCNFVVHEMEELWAGEKQEFRPEVLDIVKHILNSGEGANLRIGAIKSRRSNTVGHSYRSFGCYRCDNIFGDWYVMNATLEARNGYYKVIPFEIMVTIRDEVSVPFPHWCYPDNRMFCDYASRAANTVLQPTPLR